MENKNADMLGITGVGVCKGFGEKQVLNGVDFFFPYGKTSVIQGKSGCGKTTLLRIIAGLEDLDSGSINGVDKSRVAVLFQDDRLLPWLTAQKNVEAVIRDKARKGLATEILTELGLGDAKDLCSYPAELSGGMSRRVAIARALAYLAVSEGEILILDEALRGLDEENVANTVSVIKKYSAKKTVISVTHELSALETDAAVKLVL